MVEFYGFFLLMGSAFCTSPLYADFDLSLLMTIPGVTPLHNNTPQTSRAPPMYPYLYTERMRNI